MQKSQLIKFRYQYLRFFFHFAYHSCSEVASGISILLVWRFFNQRGFVIRVRLTIPLEPETGAVKREEWGELTRCKLLRTVVVLERWSFVSDLVPVPNWGQYHQHAYVQLLLAQMIWHLTSISPTILCPTLPLQLIRNYAQIYNVRSKLCARMISVNFMT